MHRKRMLWGVAACFALALAACGTPELEGEAAVSAPELEQGIGVTPLCPSDMYYVGTIQSKTEWAASCGGCTTSGLAGRKGTVYERCCRQDRAGDAGPVCGAWTLIKSVCQVCGPE
ncbi:hypothetical protein [Stigmatella aurantiaca]|uniref:Lipoprotein n=1 Tax=Stigmatella aurantiaca (strain DW4/3-1) TaxID=378806 RepID=E3FG49_STIAD|nr:hypothetical protein [Stigmatella aurantiaca]ADO68984.1 uncharacterized protein STAUR_1180 [Stigmatella aurantiaca DW4/3-1]